MIDPIHGPRGTPIYVDSIIYCRSLGKWTARLECGLLCNEPHYIIPVSPEQAAAWLNMLIQARDDMIDGGNAAYWLPSKIAAVLPRIGRED